MKNYLTYFPVALLLVVQLFFLMNLQFTAWPEMLAYPYLRNNGFLLYKDMIHPYPLLLTMFMSVVYKLFGYDLWVLESVAWLIILSSSVILYYVINYVTRSHALALLGLAFYVFIQPFLEGNMLWFDIVIVPPILLGLFFLLRNNIFLAGLFLAAAALTKQTAGLYLVFSILYLVFIRKIRLNQLKSIFYGPLLLGVPLVFRLIQEGALGDFINWVLVYPLTKWGSIIGYVQMELSTRDWLVVVVLFAPLIYIALNRQIPKDKSFQILLIFLVGSLISVYPRFSFFHFQTAIAMLVIIYSYFLSRVKITRLTIACCLLPIAFIFFLVHKPAVALDWQKEARFYGEEDKQMARIISGKVGKSERVYLLGLHSGLYAMADRLPPERWTDNFPWYLEIPGVQEEILSRWEQNPPHYVVWRQPSAGNWFDLGTYQPQKIVQYIKTNYNFEGEIKTGIQIWRRKS